MQAHETARVAPAKSKDDPRKVFGLGALNTCEDIPSLTEIQPRCTAWLARWFLMPSSMARVFAKPHFVEATR
jgi:hypothetical protein